MKKNNICVLTLGCSKNVVDSENLIGILENNNFNFTEDINKADTLLINTCGFINSSKQESLEVIFDAIELKKRGKIKTIGVMGCLSERYKPVLGEQLPQVDHFFGVNSFPEIIKTLTRKEHYELTGERHLLTPKHFAYLKISEGCNHTCSFCAIPLIRGNYISKTYEQLTAEVKALSAAGVKELNIIAQDTTYYGKDIYGKQTISKLLSEITPIDGIEWFRLLYAYPVSFPDDIIDEIATNSKICKYIDIPLQHISDKILKSMGRGGTATSIYKLIDKIRTKIPDVAIRSTFIVGYPGETEKDVRALYNFLKDTELDRVGIFTYSHEENTPAFIHEDTISQEEKNERRNMLMELQQGISLAKNKAKVGQELKVIVDGFSEGYYVCRSEHDAPEVDNSVLVKTSKKIKTGDFINVKITRAKEYDLYAKY